MTTTVCWVLIDVVTLLDAGAWLEVLQHLLAAMQIPHRIVIGTLRLLPKLSLLVSPSHADALAIRPSLEVFRCMPLLLIRQNARTLPHICCALLPSPVTQGARRSKECKAETRQSSWCSSTGRA